MGATQAARKERGAYGTPPAIAALLAEQTLADIDDAGDWARWPHDRPVRVLDPACGDGRLLVAMGDRLLAGGRSVELVGCDVDDAALAVAATHGIRCIHADALGRDWGGERFDIVVGNPPYLSQMAAVTTRGRSSRHGGGPYADAAAEFLSLAVGLADAGHGRVALVLPQSILASRDAGPIRDSVDRVADLAWSWWRPDQRLFDASVNVCLIGLRRPATGTNRDGAWTRVVTDELGVPWLDRAELVTDGTVGDRAELTANFRDEYYALAAAVADDANGPPLVTSGLIDPGRCWWGRRPVRFNKQVFDRPRVDLARLEGRFVDWAARKLVPKVLVANQTRRVEAVADVDGRWLPGVPVTAVTPRDGGVRTVREIEAVLCSPVASALCWQQGAGTGLSTTTVRVSPALLASIPWPAGGLDDAIGALARGAVGACGEAVLDAYGVEPTDQLLAWWSSALPEAMP